MIRLSYETGFRVLKAVLALSLVASAAVGAYIAVTDSYLWLEAPTHAYGLIAFVVLDLVTVGMLFFLPRLSRVLAVLLPAAQLTLMAGDLYMGLGAPGSVVQEGFHEYLLNNPAFMALLVVQAALVGLSLGYLVQPRPGLAESRSSVREGQQGGLNV